MKRCTRCILAEDFPNIKFDSNGVCNYCHEWDRKWRNFGYEQAEKDLISIFNWARSKKRKYDCLIPYSGGRDSSYVVYLCRKKYQMNPLVVTFNNLFMTEYALQNIFKMVSILNVDHLYITYKPDMLKKFYRAAISHGGEFCSICSAGINYVKLVYQRLHDIPIVITGTSSRVDEQSPFEVNCSHPLYVRRVLAKGGFEQDEVEDLIIKRHLEWGVWEKVKRKIKGNDYIEIALPNYIKWKNQDIQNILEKELGWQTPDKWLDHIDCRFTSMKAYLKNRQIPHYIFKQEKFSQLIRDRQMSREEALVELERLMVGEDQKPKEYDEFMDFLGLESSDMQNLKGVSHLDYVSKEDVAFKESTLAKMISVPWQVYKYFKGGS